MCHTVSSTLNLTSRLLNFMSRLAAEKKQSLGIHQKPGTGFQFPTRRCALKAPGHLISQGWIFQDNLFYFCTSSIPPSRSFNCFTRTDTALRSIVANVHLIRGPRESLATLGCSYHPSGSIRFSPASASRPRRQARRTPQVAERPGQAPSFAGGGQGGMGRRGSCP